MNYFESHDIPESHQVSIAKSRMNGHARQFWMRLEDHKESRGEYPTSDWKDMRRELKLKYLPSTCDQPSDFKIRSPPVHQTFRYCILKNPTRESQSYSSFTLQSDIVTPSPHQVAVTHFPTSVITPKPVRHTTPTHVSNQGVAPTPSDLHLEHHLASFVGTNHGHHCGRDHPSFSSIWVAAPSCRSSPSLDGRPSIGSSVGSVPYDSPLGLTPSHPSQPCLSTRPLCVVDPDLPHLVGDFTTFQFNVNSEATRPLASPVFDRASCIHFVDTDDITDNEDFFEDETEVVELDSLHNLNPDLRDLEPLNIDTLAHPDPNLIKDVPLDKVCRDDINLILKETDLTLNTLKLNSEDSDLIISPTELTPNNSDLILNNFDGDVDNLELEVIQLNLLPDLNPDLIDPESIDLRVLTKPDPIENINMNLEDSNLDLNDSEPNLKNEHPLVLLDSIFGVAPLNLHLKNYLS
ncbi:hypothetical protein M5K25_020984 [Dendrobium thyrsiflorum]|uniref:Retrotransposon gag domain-containing protein n=1 Tax=Dendrobium thyrsiflorum TaxID=117978 RepID=A0ABD0UIB2_DENTH